MSFSSTSSFFNIPPMKYRIVIHFQSFDFRTLNIYLSEHIQNIKKKYPTYDSDIYAIEHAISECRRVLTSDNENYLIAYNNDPKLFIKDKFECALSNINNSYLLKDLLLFFELNV